MIELLFEGIKDVLKRYILFVAFQGLMAIEMVLTCVYEHKEGRMHD